MRWASVLFLLDTFGLKRVCYENVILSRQTKNLLVSMRPFALLRVTALTFSCLLGAGRHPHGRILLGPGSLNAYDAVYAFEFGEQVIELVNAIDIYGQRDEAEFVVFL